MDNCLVSCTEIYKSFGKVHIFENMDIKIYANKIIGLLGENGSGKTSFIKMLSGMLLPDKGEISLFGKEIVSEKDIIYMKSKVSILGDANRSLYWNMSGIDNLYYFWTIKTGKRGLYGKERINELIIQFNMEEFIQKKVESYSKGMKQRLLLVVALLGTPKLLIMDEPLNGLDFENTIILKDYMNEFVKKENGTVILTSHNSRFIDEVCDTKFMIKDHKIVEISNTECGGKKIIIYYKNFSDKVCFQQYEKEKKEKNIFKIEVSLQDNKFYQELSVLIENKDIAVLDII